MSFERLREFLCVYRLAHENPLTSVLYLHLKIYDGWESPRKTVHLRYCSCTSREGQRLYREETALIRLLSYSQLHLQRSSGLSLLTSSTSDSPGPDFVYNYVCKTALCIKLVFLTNEKLGIIDFWSSKSLVTPGIFIFKENLTIPYTPRKPDLKETRAPQCSSQHCL